MQIPKLSLFFLALIVLTSILLKVQKRILQERQMNIYIYMHILSIIRGF